MGIAGFSCFDENIEQPDRSTSPLTAAAFRKSPRPLDETSK
ncbi:hypothetical protein GMO_14290 [Gluconobacter morbifer G707]|uniref:Uncharacterized protein n=1 Tax=Gluconobacter morbifer G707 TaxID=1088869 RepID=G6XIL9_9PROT|nr:hypothetical protein GMO_14290 [Gluconobacter morbifer G707]